MLLMRHREDREMNKYQKKFHREVKAYIKDHRSIYDYRDIKIIKKWQVKYQAFSPCEDCDNQKCRLIKNKLFYCKYNL